MSRNAMGMDGVDVSGVDGSRVFVQSMASTEGCVDGVGVWIWSAENEGWVFSGFALA